MEEKKWWIPYIVAGILLLAGTFYDYSITAFLYDLQNVFAIFMQCGVIWLFIAVVTFVFTMQQRLHKSVFFFLAEIISALYTVIELMKYFVNIRDHLFLIGILGILLVSFCNMIVYHMSLERLQRLEKKAVFYVCVLILSTLLVAVLKYFWGRIRFREMEQAVQFSAWFLPQGCNGHHSFPSGHTAAISSLLCLFVTMKDCEEHKVPWYIGVFVFGMIITMAVSRMIMGAHFLSDTTVGFLVTYTVFLCSRHYFYQKRYI